MDWNDKLEADNDHQRHLRNQKWQETRLEVFERDNYTCKLCGNKKDDESQLEAHHWQYVDWDFYNPDYIFTLCKRCHRDIHSVSEALVKGFNTDSRIQNGINEIKEGLAEIIDPYVIPRCAELTPDGDVHFFTGSNQININTFIDGLLWFDPIYREQVENIKNKKILSGAYGNARWTRYQNMRLNRKKGVS